jgi:hypothetical protein
MQLPPLETGDSICVWDFFFLFLTPLYLPVLSIQGRPFSRSSSGVLEIDPPPERGNMDIREVINSPFFFS